MLNTIWCGMMLLSIITALFTGRTADLANALQSGAQEAVTLSISMLGMMCFWTGLLRIADRAGVTRALSRLFSPLICRLFPDYKKDPVIKERISMNISANLLGLGNAATPLGLAAIKEMAVRKGEQPSNGMMLFIVLNTASLQLIPTYAITLRSNYGSSDPYAILPAVWVVSTISLVVCITASKIFESRCRNE